MNRIVLFCLLVFSFSFITNAQSTKSQFSKLSGPEKCWVFWHPFKAKKAFNVSLEALRVTDSLDGVGILGHDINGGKLDAFKHSYWMAIMSRRIGKKPALKLGKAHEKGNYETFKKGQLEDGFLPDKPSSDMDLFNNKMGVEIAEAHKHLTVIELITVLVEAIEKGDLRVLRKADAAFLTCDGRIIPANEFKGKWENEKCLVPSNQ